MSAHKIVTRREWLAARLELLKAEKRTDPPQRQVRASAPGIALGASRQGIRFRYG
jgi:hypothetical protein